MIITKKPQVFMYNHTPLPSHSVALAVSAWHTDDIIESPDDLSDDQAAEYAEKAFKAYHRTALEYVSMTWVIKNVSRAFQQQLTRTRLAAYAIQSLRIVTKGAFADEGRYTMPPGITDDQQHKFHDAMVSAQNHYQWLIDNGFKAEHARGALPLNIHSDISMTINFAALTHMLTQRFCVNTQWEYRQVAAQMKALVAENLGEKFSALLDAPCVKTKKCPMGTDFCGTPVWKLEPAQRVEFYTNYTVSEKAP